MQTYVHSDKQYDYYADFERMVLFVTDKVRRATSIVPIEFEPEIVRFHAKKPVCDAVLLFLLPLYQRFLETNTVRQELIRAIQSLDLDLNDDAARDFNPFEKGPR